MDNNEKICPFCKTKISENDDVIVCPKCEIPHHTECWQENKGCTTFGCGVKAQEPVPENRICSNCGNVLIGDAKFCGICGQGVINTPNANVYEAPQIQNNNKCTSCGMEIKDNMAFCGNCGQKVENKSNNNLVTNSDTVNVNSFDTNDVSHNTVNSGEVNNNNFNNITNANTIHNTAINNTAFNNTANANVANINAANTVNTNVQNVTGFNNGVNLDSMNTNVFNTTNTSNINNANYTNAGNYSTDGTAYHFKVAEDKPKKKSKTVPIVVAIILCISIVVGVIVFNNVKAKKQREAKEDYLEAASDFLYYSLEAGQNLEEIADTIQTYWYENIWYDEHGSDINEAIMYAQLEMVGEISLAEDYDSKMSSLYNELKKVPNDIAEKDEDEIEEICDAVKELYDVYLEFYTLATDPSGNYNSYSSSNDELTEEFISKYKALENIIE